MKRVVGLWGMMLLSCVCASAQVDTSYVYNTSTPYGTLDIRIAKSSTRFYYLQENKTVSFRENGGTKTNTYLDMTNWDSSPYAEGNLREKSGSADYFIMNYRLLAPLNYNKTYSPGYPLIVMMHGAGERGNCWNSTCYHADKTWKPSTNTPSASTASTSKLMNNDHNLLHGGKVHLDARNLAGAKLPNDPTMPGRAFPGFVLFPQNLNGWDANAVNDAIRLIRLVAKKYNIDEDRIYLQGLSNGGGAVYHALKKAPWLFAAALPMSAADDGGISAKNLWASVAHIPMWTFQGGQDLNPSPNETNGYVKRMRDAGGIIRYSFYPELGHGTWNTAYKEPDFFKWILNKNKSNIHVFAGSASICLTNKQGVRMEVAKGFRAYQWEKDGAIISGATGSSYVANVTGKYRARFSRVKNPTASDWNQWSEYVTVSQQNPPAPQVEQIGTVLLKDLNSYGNARLKASKEAAHYYWYKNGTLVNLSGSQDDTTQYPTFYAGTCSSNCTGNGTYTLITAGADGCPSPPSSPKYMYFNNQAPLTISAPTNFTGQIASLSSVKLTWGDASTNEGGFEIWRRHALGTAYSKWEMRTLTTANVRTFTDTGLEPSTKYHYKIRAVSSSGRSNYTPAASNAYLTIVTNEDNANPSAPQSLTAKAIAINTIQLSWNASTDNTGIRQYRIYYGANNIVTNSTKTTYTLTNLNLNTVYNFTVRAEDLGGNLGSPSNTATANTYVSGLYYEHSTGAWIDIDQVNWTALPEFTGTVKNFTLTPRTQEDYFNFEFDGYLYINGSGTYRFRTISSDGSRLELDGVVIVNNDGVHGNRTITSADKILNAGPHKVNLKYFEYDGSQTLTVQYYGADTGNKWINIPDGALRSGTPPSTTMMASVAREANSITEDSAAHEDVTVNIYPNPTSQDNINMQLESVVNKPVQVVIMDYTGRQVYKNQFQTDELKDGFRLEPSEKLNKGFYLLIVNQSGKTSKHRISINN